VEDGPHVVARQHALQQRLVRDAAADRVGAFRRCDGARLAPGPLVANQTDDAGAALEQGGDHPGPEQPGAAGDEDAPGVPEIIARIHGAGL
jgi:hypothetical protein